MKNKPFYLLFALFVLWRAAVDTPIIDVLSKKKLGKQGYDIFTSEFGHLVLLGALLIFLAALLLPASKEPPSSRTIGYWYMGFLGILILSGGIVMYANPEGNYPWNRRDAYIAIEAKSQKLDYYKKIEKTPDVILFGSSASFQIPMNYFEENWGKRGFNLSVSGGGPVDFVNLLNVVRETSPNAEMPSVVLVEILSPALKVGNSISMPLEFIPHMSSMGQKQNSYWQLFHTTFQVKLLSDSVFTLAVVDRDRWIVPVVVDPENGTITRRGSERKNQKQYERAIESAIPFLNPLKQCEDLDEGGVQALEMLVRSSREHKFALVFYRIPINDDYYKFSGFNPPDYARCERRFKKYMRALTDENPNIFFRDLNQDKELTTGGANIYLDTHHLTRLGSLRLLQSLNGEIESALRWVEENR